MEKDAQDIGQDIGQPEGIVEGGYVIHGFSQELIGKPFEWSLTTNDRRTRRWFLGKAAKIGGAAFAVGMAAKLGFTEQEAIASTSCNCGVYNTGSWSCEYNSRGTRTGRVSFFYRGKSYLCSQNCSFWGAWHCDTSACPAPYCPNY